MLFSSVDKKEIDDDATAGTSVEENGKECVDTTDYDNDNDNDNDRERERETLIDRWIQSKPAKGSSDSEPTLPISERALPILNELFRFFSPGTCRRQPIQRRH